MSQDHPIDTPLRRDTNSEVCRLLQASLSTIFSRKSLSFMLGEADFLYGILLVA